MISYSADTDQNRFEIQFVTQQLEPFDHLNTLVVTDPLAIDPALVEQINQSMDIVVIPQMSHPHNYGTRDHDIRSRGINKPWLQMTWDTSFPDTPNFIKIFYWAAHIHNFMYDPEHAASYQSNRSNTRKYLYSCLNNWVKAHRLGVLIKIFHSSYCDNCVLSMTKKLSSHTPLDFESARRDVLEFTHYTNQAILQLFDSLPHTCAQEPIHQVSFWSHDAYRDSYVNVVTEHDFRSQFFSEKSIKPFLTETMAIFVAGAGTVQLLRQAGLDVFDDIIDHSYDNQQDPTARMSQIHSLLDQMSAWNWPHIYAATAARRQANRDFLLSGTLLHRFTQTLAQSINNLVRS